MKLINFKGIYLPKNEKTKGIDFTPLRPMDFYNVPLKLQKIVESEPVVSIGQEVKEGTLIAKPAGKFGLKIYSPVSGKVLNIFDKLTSNGEYCKHILIMNDGKNEVEDLPAIDSMSDVILIDRLKDSGILDNISKMPAFMKYAYTGSKSYKKLFILMDEIDPNSTINQTLAEFKMKEVENGAKYFMKCTNAQSVTFVFTDKNRRIASKLKDHIAKEQKDYYYKIKFIPSKYPFMNPYILTNLLTGKKITKKTSFLDAGIAIETAESCYNFCRAVEFNKPVTRKMVTVDGDNIIRKGNFIIPNGVSYENLIDFVGFIEKTSEINLIEGNVMQGRAQYNKEISVSLNTDSIVVIKHDDFVEDDEKEINCISCGRCVGVCPMGLDPKRLEIAFMDDDYDELDKLKVQSCIECGCCSYVCPSKRYITQRLRDAKFYLSKFKEKNGGK